MSLTASPAPSAAALSVAGTNLTVPAPNMEAVREIYDTMKQTLEALGTTFETLGQTTSKVSKLHEEPALDAAGQVMNLRRHLAHQDRRQKEKMAEIERLLRDVLQEEIVEHLKTQIDEQIGEIINDEVQEQVEEQLKHHIPAMLQETVAEHKRQLDDVQRALTNSEARRANGLLKSTRVHDPLEPLLMSDGNAHESFPKDLQGLLSLDETMAMALIEAYGLPLADTREKNLNKFMQFCGVAYHVVSSSPSHLSLVPNPFETQPIITHVYSRFPFQTAGTHRRSVGIGTSLEMCQARIGANCSSTALLEDWRAWAISSVVMGVALSVFGISE